MRPVLLVPFVAGCATQSLHLGKPANTLADDPVLGSLERAELLRRQGNYLDATVEYRKVLESSQDRWEREQARIGGALALIKLHRLPAAMATLGPLPATPQGETDSHKLAIAGEIYLRHGRSEEAEVCLELAVDSYPLETFLAKSQGKVQPEVHAKHDQKVPLVTPAGYNQPAQMISDDLSPEIIPPGVIVGEPDAGMMEGELPGLAHPDGLPMMAGDLQPPSWLGGCCANLGCAYLRNDKPEKAIALYAFAAEVFRMQNNRIAAEKAQRASDDLIDVLRQYAPYKPAPLSRHLPPGKSY